ncbi:MAG: abortive infection family protein [Candidatus Cloacimonetes bacterium]|nr:abortive infection family protein [Candidatus Cloacimonadota bacterium]
MNMKLDPKEANILVRGVYHLFRHYSQYEKFFVDIGIIDYADPRDSSKQKALLLEFSKRTGHDLYQMLVAMKQYISACNRPNTTLSINYLDDLIDKYFPGVLGGQIVVPKEAPDTVQAACEEANRLITEGKYSNAIDRVHTFFQGYIRNKCSSWQIDIAADANIKDALLSIIDNHQYFSEINRMPELKNVFKSLSNMCDRFDTIRNRHSLAHPTESLLASNESKLMINVIRSLYEYIEAIGKNG